MGTQVRGVPEAAPLGARLESRATRGEPQASEVQRLGARLESRATRGEPQASEVQPLTGGAAEGEASIGRYLARQRELRGISLEDLAALTKIPHRSLERLEAGAFDRQPDGFARGFVRTVAAALGLDPDEAVMRLLREPPDEDDAPVGARRFGPVAAVLGGLALLAAGVALWSASPGAGPPPPERAAGQTVVRRDAVRSLAEQQPPTGSASEPRPAPSEAEASPPPAR